jgi:undecaprenyl diphosphate synthase
MRNNIPQHIAIIMDGNGRWAQEKKLPRTTGHRIGVSRVKEIIRAANDLGIKVVTFFAFSAENWQRPKGEIAVLMRFLDNFLTRQIGELEENNMRLKIIGRGDPLPEYIQKKIKEAEAKTKNNTGLMVVLALNYGSRQEILDAVKKFTRAVIKGEVKLDNLASENFANYLYTAGLPDPDLLIRTSGEMRLSNFLLWQLSYAELYFPRKYWPDFGRSDLEEAIRVYQSRERRFGKINAD